MNIEEVLSSGKPTISSAPLITPQRTLLYHRPPARASSGNSTNSARGLSSIVSEKNDPIGEGCGCGVEPDFDGAGGVLCVTVGVMFKNDLNPTFTQ